MNKAAVTMIIITGMVSMIFALIMLFVTFWSGHTQIRDFGYQTTLWLITSGLLFILLNLLQRLGK